MIFLLLIIVNQKHITPYANLNIPVIFITITFIIIIIIILFILHVYHSWSPAEG